MAVTALRREPDPDSDATRRTLNEEFRLQLDYAERRAREREQERSKTQATLGQPGGLVAANDPERVAKRLDRVTRYLAGGDPKESPQSATAENLVRSAVERATTSCGIAVPERADADGAAPTGVLEKPRSAPPQEAITMIGTISRFFRCDTLDSEWCAVRWSFIPYDPPGRAQGWLTASVMPPIRSPGPSEPTAPQENKAAHRALANS